MSSQQELATNEIQENNQTLHSPTNLNHEKALKTDSNKKKRSPNWLPQEEEQLARSWLKVSEQAQFITNQTSESFFKAVELDFNIHSKIHYRDHDQIRTRWAALNTATLKFSAIYNAIEKSPPKNSTSNDWINLARKIYLQQSKGHAFKDELAWQNLRHASKWKQDNRKLNFQSHISPDLTLDAYKQHEESNQQQQNVETKQPLTQHLPEVLPARSESSVTTPQDHSPMLNSSIIQDIEGPRLKKLRIEQDLDRLILQSQDDSIHSIPVIPTNQITPNINQTYLNQNNYNSKLGNSITGSGSSSSNVINSKMIIHEEEINKLKKENLELERDSKRSQIEMNDLKLILQSETDCPDEESVMLLRLMKSRLKKRLLSQQY